MIRALPRTTSDNIFSTILSFAQTQSHSALCAMLNHLLSLEPELQSMLAHHAKSTLQLRWPPVVVFPAGALTLRITDERRFAPCEWAVPADVVVTVLDGFFSAPQDQKLRFLRVEGDAMLAQTLALLAQRLRWDAEHDLARWIGDTNAGFLARHARAFATEVLHAAQSLDAAAKSGLNVVADQAQALGIDVQAVKTQLDAMIGRAKSHMQENTCAARAADATKASV